MTRLFLMLLWIPALVSCDTIHGISIQGKAAHMPDVAKLKNHLNQYREIDEVDTMNSEGGRPLTLTGVKKADKIQYFNYRGDSVHGSIYFATDYTGSIRYSHSLLQMHSPPPQSVIDASWPVMKRIEHDMEHVFGLADHSARTQTAFINVSPANKTAEQVSAGNPLDAQ